MKKILLILCLTSFSFLGFSQSQIDLPITWDDTATVDYSVIDFGGDSSLISSGPVNASNIVLKTIKKSGSQTWAGTVLGNDSLATAIPFTAGNTLMRVAVYSPDSGIAVRLKVENEANGALSVETETKTTIANAWDTLTFDFANNVTGTPAINFATTYDKIAIFFDFGTAGTGKTYYTDLVEYIAGTSKPPISLPITWDDSAVVNTSVIDFGGDSSLLDADPTNASNVVLKTIKRSGAQTWAGTTFTDSLNQAIPFQSGYTTITAAVYSPDSGTVVRLKVEDAGNPAISVETDAKTTKANAWDTLSFDMANHVAATSAINFANKYNKMSIFYDFGTGGSGKTYYVDDVEYNEAPPRALIGLPITWDDTNNVDYTIADFGGNASVLAVDPTNSMNNVLKTEKTSTAQTWAGTSLGNALSAPIAVSVGYTTIRAVVYAPDTGIVVKMKIEDANDPTKSVETDVKTTVANAWDTLSFDMANQSPMTAAIDYTYTYNKMSIFYDFGVAGVMGGKTFYLDFVDFEAEPAKALIELPITWDDTNTVDYTIVDFGGNASVLDVDPTNSGNNVLKSEKTSTAQTWAGTSFGNSLAAAIPFSSGNTTVRAVVYAPDTGLVVKLKVEDATNGALSVETDVKTTVANAWDTLSFDFSNHSSGTPAINFATTYDKMSIFYDFGVAGVTGGKIFYVDYVEYMGAVTSLKELTDNNIIKIYPNPAQNQVTISTKGIDQSSVGIQILNSVGQLMEDVSSRSVSNDKVILDVSKFDNGLYFVVLSSDKGQSISKLFIAK